MIDGVPVFYRTAGEGWEHAGEGTEHAGEGTEHAGEGREHAGEGTEHAGEGTEHAGEGRDHARQGSPGAGPLYLHDALTSSDDLIPFLERTGGLAPDVVGFGRSGKG